MIRDGGTQNPRHQVAAGRKADGRWVVVAVNATEGVDTPSSFLGAQYGAATQQLTVNVLEMAGMARAFTARRADINGVVSGFSTVNMQDGLIRFTLAASESIALEQVLA
jgi:hypothetical protein